MVVVDLVFFVFVWCCMDSSIEFCSAKVLASRSFCDWHQTSLCDILYDVRFPIRIQGISLPLDNARLFLLEGGGRQSLPMNLEFIVGFVLTRVMRIVTCNLTWNVDTNHGSVCLKQEKDSEIKNVYVDNVRVTPAANQNWESQKYLALAGRRTCQLILLDLANRRLRTKISHAETVCPYVHSSNARIHLARTMFGRLQQDIWSISWRYEPRW